MHIQNHLKKTTFLTVMLVTTFSLSAQATVRKSTKEIVKMGNDANAMHAKAASLHSQGKTDEAMQTKDTAAHMSHDTAQAAEMKRFSSQKTGSSLTKTQNQMKSIAEDHTAKYNEYMGISSDKGKFEESDGPESSRSAGSASTSRSSSGSSN